VAAPDHPGDVVWLADPHRRGMVVLALNLVPFAAIAFLWFIGVVRDRIGQREDRFFATVFLGSGLLFVAMLFVPSAVTAAILADTAARPRAAEEVSGFGRSVGPSSCTSMRCAWPPSSRSRRRRLASAPGFSRGGSPSGGARRP
jgi:MFS family permease